MITRLAIGLAIASISIPASAASAAAPVAPRHAAPGKSIVVSAGGSRYYLSRDSKRSLDDVRLIAPRAHARRSATAAKAVQLAVPPISAGSYRLLACTGTRCAASRNLVTVGAGPATQMQAYSDSHDLQDQYLADNARFNPSICPTPAPPGPLPSTAGALKAAQALLAQAAGPQGMAAFKNSAAYKSADAGEAAAVEAVAVGKPGAALAALLRAHELQPDEPRYLVAAAAILTGLGHPKEALALVNGADALAPTKSAPFGINTQAVALNAKGEALLALGQFSDAETFLRAAIAIEPLLAEAKQNLAIALMCAKKDDEGMRFFRAGSVRQGTLNPDGTVSLPPLEDLLDTTHGTTATLPPIPLPESFTAAKGSVQLYTNIGNASAARLHDMRTRANDLMQQNFAHPDSLFTQQRDLEIIKLALDPPQFRDRKDALVKLMGSTHAAVLKLAEDIRDTGLTWQHNASVACSGIYDNAKWQACYDNHYQNECAAPANDAANKISELVAAEDKADREFIADYYPWATAVLANISNPAVQERWSLVVADSVESTWTMPMGALTFWVNTAKNMYCGKPPASPPDGFADAPVTPHSEPCPPFVKGVKLSWKFAPVKGDGIPFDLGIEVNCDKVSLETSGAIEGWVGVFGQVDWSPRSGKMTVFAGPKLNAKIPGTSIGGSFKDGLYVTFKGDDSIGDFGFRTSVSGAVGFGPFSIKGGDSMDFSFAPVFGLAR